MIRCDIVIPLYYDNNDQSECCFRLPMQFYRFVQTTFYDHSYGKSLTVYRINRQIQYRKRNLFTALQQRRDYAFAVFEIVDKKT